MCQQEKEKRGVHFSSTNVHFGREQFLTCASSRPKTAIKLITSKASVMTWWTVIRGPLRALGISILIVATALNLFIYNYHNFQPDVCSWTSDSPDIRLLAFGDPQIRGAGSSSSWRTQVDLYGNDYYLGHIYRTLVVSLLPKQVAVMGDLLSSQWISDDQFYERVGRYSQRIFDPALLSQRSGGEIINITGNHDIGYAGEVTPERMARYLDVFGPVNFVKTYDLSEHPYRIVVLNSLVLDGPMAHQVYSDEAWAFLDEVASAGFEGPTILLTHVPLYKNEGICEDGPYFTYYGPEYGNVLREQNHLSEEASEAVLNKVFGPANPYGGVILTGHDHEGCESTYVYDSNAGKWTAKRSLLQDYPGSVQEITVRSMMGEFGGNAGLLQGMYTDGTWTFRYSLCPFVIQHWWWAAKVLAIISVGIAAPVLSGMWIGLI